MSGPGCLLGCRHSDGAQTLVTTTITLATLLIVIHILLDRPLPLPLSIYAEIFKRDTCTSILILKLLVPVTPSP